MTDTMMHSPSKCPVCGVSPNNYHIIDCEFEQCAYCGESVVECLCEAGPLPLDDRIPWSGSLPGVAECREWGWYARLLPGLGWVPCSQDDPMAVEHLQRFHYGARWDRETKQFVRDEATRPVVPP